MSFPVTEEEFEALAAQGLTVQCTETPDAQTPPDGDGWVYWSDRAAEGEIFAVWRRIVPLEEAQ